MGKPKKLGIQPHAVTKPRQSRPLLVREESSVSRNASGYQKRQERKKSDRRTDDLYEYAAARNKRAGITLDVDREERGYEQSRNSATKEGDLDNDMEALRQKISASVGDDLGIVDSEDDEDIDSDEAFEGESDEERFGNFKFVEKGKLSKRNPEHPFHQSKGARFPIDHSAEVDLNEDDTVMRAPGASAHSDSGEEDGISAEDDDKDDGRGVPLSAILDGGSNPLSEPSDSEPPDEDEDDVLAPSDNEAGSLPAEDSLAKLDRFIDELNPVQKRKASELENGGNVSRKRKRRNLEECNEAGVESEFATRGGLDGKLGLDDLLKPLANLRSSDATLEKTARMLASTKVESLAAPLPTRAQERLDRQTAYETTKEEVEKWAPTMKRIREAEHLSFPLQKAPMIKPSTSQLTGKFRPSNELESAVDQLLKSAKLRESDIDKTEELEMSHLTLEEVAARRAELRHMRELMFRAEAKAKRVAKIKSKTYRKIQKKARERNALTLDEIATLDPDAATAERAKIEAARAKERVTMRHKNTGKWARQMVSRGQNLDVDQRRELNAQLERGEQLRRKIQGDEDDDELSDSPSNPDEAAQDIADRAFDELRAVQARDVPTPTSGKKAGLLDMKFMRDAADRDDREVDAIVDHFQNGLVDLISDDKGVQIPQAPTLSDSITVRGNEGRMMFKPRAEGTHPVATPKVVAQFSTESDTSSTTIKSSVELNGDSSQLPPSPVETRALNAHPLTTKVENPWLTIANTNAKLSRKTNEALVSKGSSADVRSQAALKKQLARSEEALAHQAEDALVEIDPEDSLPLPPSSVSFQTTNGKKRKSSQNIESAAVDSAFQDSDDEGVNQGEQSTKAFKQRELVALAFAGDNVIEEFNSSKQREIEAAAPKEIDTTLPGWGVWGGKGVRKRGSKLKPHLVKKMPGIAPSARADVGKAHVIISERKDKKASKYLVRDLPYPYTSKAQFERSLEQPVGPEWNTRMAFQKGTLPKVVKKMGTVIDPLQRMF